MAGRLPFSLVDLSILYGTNQGSDSENDRFLKTQDEKILEEASLVFLGVSGRSVVCLGWN